MKILHLSSEKSWRGGEQQMAYLIEELQKLGVSSHAAVRRNSAFEKWCAEKSIPFISLGFKNDFDFVSAWKLKKHCHKNGFDLIHLHSSRSHGMAVLAAALGNKTPLVLSRRVDFPLKGNIFSRWKYNHSSIKKIICVSDKIKEIVSKELKHPERCVTVHDGVDLQRFTGKGFRGNIRKEFGISDDEKIIGNIAALAPHKDYFTFLDTIEILSQKTKAKYIIAGEGPLREQIESRISELKLQQTVFVLGFRYDLENVFADLDVLLYTSKEEGLGSTLLDAMAYGIPIVTTEAGGIPEIVKNEFNGLTAPVGDSARLAEQVIRMIQENSLREKLITNAGTFVKKFSKEEMAKKTLEVYNGILLNPKFKKSL
ncbi:MAG: glycosyltransferase family 4 protein [Bacteroidota bacterium]